MNHPYFNLVSVPVTISIVVICDIRVLVRKHNSKYCFPFKFLEKDFLSCQHAASKIANNIMHVDVNFEKWLPVDIRSFKSRKQPIMDKYTLDIGYATILDLEDLPIVGEDYYWQLVNFDDSKFPLDLEEDHSSLWDATNKMIDLIR